jgi:hypothetical protein
MKRRDLLLGTAGAAGALVATAALLEPTAAPVLPPAKRTYSTDFAGNEEPLSEGGSWSNAGLDWTTVRKANGMACGTQTGSGGYNDSYAKLSGFGADQAASAVIALNPQIDHSCSHEVELLLRCSDAPHRAMAYECNLSFDGTYCEIVAWNGKFGDFSYLARGKVRRVRTGDVLKAVAQGSVITVYLNDSEVTRAEDKRYPIGDPGIGFFRRACGANSDYGFSSYTAVSW